MTCCLAVKVAGRVVVAADTRVMEDGSILRPMRKISADNRGWIVALSGCIEDGLAALRDIDCKLPDRPASTFLLPADAGDSELLLVREGRVWTCSGRLAHEAGDVAAIGEARDIALGYVMRAHPPSIVAAKRLAVSALRACAKVYASVGAPYEVVVV